MKSNETNIAKPVASQVNEREQLSRPVFGVRRSEFDGSLNDREVPGVSNDQAKPESERKRRSSRLLIIGYGNPLRGDDGVGWQIADQLARLAGDSAKVLTVHQLTPELSEPIRGADLVVFIDACYGGRPGTWTCETIRPDPNPSHKLTHYFAPANLLSYTRTVFGVNPKALLVSVAGRSFDYSEDLSPSVAAIVPEILASVSEWWNADAE